MPISKNPDKIVVNALRINKQVDYEVNNVERGATGDNINKEKTE